MPHLHPTWRAGWIHFLQPLPVNVVCTAVCTCGAAFTATRTAEAGALLSRPLTQKCALANTVHPESPRAVREEHTGARPAAPHSKQSRARGNGGYQAHGETQAQVLSGVSQNIQDHQSNSGNIPFKNPLYWWLLNFIRLQI